MACVSAYMGNALSMINNFRLHIKALKPFLCSGNAAKINDFCKSVGVPKLLHRFIQGCVANFYCYRSYTLQRSEYKNSSKPTRTQKMHVFDFQRLV